MVFVDYLVLALYALGLFGIALFFTLRVKNTSDMFSAGGESPWWMSGLSGFMTMFSAGTFVVWGGVAYRYGLVAVSISLCYGVAALLVGWTLAGHWKRLGVESAAEFLSLRFGNSIVQFYVWLQGTLGMFTLGMAIYGLSVIIAALVTIAPDSALAFLGNAETSQLSVTWLSVIICTFVVVITFGGGLWAVLMTDVLQFIVLTVSVLFVVPLIIGKAGGVNAFISETPDGFLLPTAGDFTWWFLLGWVGVHYFKVGGEWAFVQRFTCVKTPKDARKSAYIFGVMYLISPVFWMLPPMIYRVISPMPDGIDAATANDLGQQAYIRACQLVLPAGMVGLMVAAMASATASMATTQLNVYAGALTTEVYQRLRPDATQREQVTAGRVLTVVLGCFVLAGAIIIPMLGTYTGFILALGSMTTAPLVLPTVWGLFSRKLDIRAVWLVTFLGIAAAVFAKFVLGPSGLLTGAIAGLPETNAFAGAIRGVNDLLAINIRVTDLVVSSTVTFLGLVTAELLARGETPGWTRVAAHQRVSDQAFAAEAARAQPTPPGTSAAVPANICTGAIALLGLLMLTLAFFDKNEASVLALFGGLLIALAAAIFFVTRKMFSSGGNATPA